MENTKEDYISNRIQKSNEIFQDTLLLDENERWNSCINRLYYSSFYLSALLIKNDIKAETHNGVKTQFNLHFVKTGIIKTEDAKLYSSLFDWRQESDYADFIDFDKDTVSPLIKMVENLNSKIINLLNN